MSDRKKKLLQYMSRLCVAMALGIIILSVESLLTQQDIYKNYALGIMAVGLLAISLLVAAIVRHED